MAEQGLDLITDPALHSLMTEYSRVQDKFSRSDVVFGLNDNARQLYEKIICTDIEVPENELDPGDPSLNSCRMEVFCRDYCRYLTDHADFIHLLVENNITHLLYDSIYESMHECGCLLGKLEAEQRSYSAGFIASGFVGIAKVYVERNCEDGADELADTLISLFSGSLL